MKIAIIYTLALCLTLASAETLNGVFRAAFLVKRIGKKSSLKVGLITGSVLGFIVCFYFVPKMGVTGTIQLLGIGLFISGFMALFDIVLSMTVLKRSFKKTLKDFNPKTGNFLIIGLMLLITFPLIVMRIQ